MQSKQAIGRFLKPFPILFLACILLISGCSSIAKSPIDWKPDLTLSSQDVEKILGEPAHLEDVSAYLIGNIKTYESSFFADSVDAITEQTGSVYFMYEEYETVQDASLSYEAIRKANEKALGVETLLGVGDEAYFHSDGTNFLFILSRNENKMVRIKVNKITSHTNKDAFMSVVNTFWK